jgi:hypothetical protein
VDALGPPILNIFLVVPPINVHGKKAHPMLDGGPHSGGETTLEEKMSRRLLLMVAKFAKATIWPTSSLKSIRRPNSILNDQPSKGFALRGRPRPPNQGGEPGKD